MKQISIIEWNPIKFEAGKLVGEVPDIAKNRSNEFLVTVMNVDTDEKYVDYVTWSYDNNFLKYYILGEYRGLHMPKIQRCIIAWAYKPVPCKVESVEKESI